MSHPVRTRILTIRGVLPALHPSDNTPIERGHIYVAPPDVHMVLEDGRIRLLHGPRENRHRPAVDPLFRSAALAFGPRVIGVILTGSMDDGTAGLFAVKRAGGVAIAQDPADATYASMPAHAIQMVPVDHIVPLADIPHLLVELVGKRVVEVNGRTVRMPNKNWTSLQHRVTLFGPTNMSAKRRSSRVRNATARCGRSRRAKSCGFAAVWGTPTLPVVFSSEMSDTTENALWTALRALEELAALHRRLTFARECAGFSSHCRAPRGRCATARTIRKYHPRATHARDDQSERPRRISALVLF